MNKSETTKVKRHSDPSIRRSQRILAMVAELHKKGYQLIRIAPGMAPSGQYWRCAITYKENILKTHGAMICTEEFDDINTSNSNSAYYSSGDGNEYFGWKDAKNDTARQLANKFLERFPKIAELGKGIDYEYAGWYVQMLGFSERAQLPIAYSDWDDEESDEWLLTTGNSDSRLPMPPSGLAGKPRY